MGIRIAIDTGGTFTDLVLFDTETGGMETLKVPSTPKSPLEAFISAIISTGRPVEQIESLVHGTTVATNALIQRKGAKVAYITSAGHEDVPYIQRINRKDPYELAWVKPKPFLLSRHHCFGLNERLNYKGEVIKELEEQEVRDLCKTLKNEEFDAAAIMLLFSYVNSMHEQRVKEIINEELPNLPISISHEVAPVWREYERATTTITDAFLKPLIQNYISSLKQGLENKNISVPLTIMKSNGGIMDANSSADKPIQLAMSGPAGGMVAVKYLADQLGLSNVLTVDMGGTSADVGIITEGNLTHTTEYELEWGVPAAIPVIDIKTIGAGGGSIAWVDKGGLLHVGPQSAGADPGPVCYNQGGEEPTISDANLLLGRLNPEYFLGGKMKLHKQLAEQKLEELGKTIGMGALEVASSIIEIANENMANAIRMISIDRGHDPRQFSLMSFGGAGSLHASAIALKLDIPKVAIPPFPGANSAFGMLMADLRVDKIWTQIFHSDRVDQKLIQTQFNRITDMAIQELYSQGFKGEPSVYYFASMRYLGQNYETEIGVDPSLDTDAINKAYDKFHSHHHEMYGYDMRGAVIELISFRVTVYGETPKPQLAKANISFKSNSIRKVYFSGHGWLDTQIIHRQSMTPNVKLSGPAVIEEEGSTTLVPPEMNILRLENDILMMEVGAE